MLVGRDLDLEKEVLSITGGKGVHLAVNGIGGNTLERTMACVKPFGMDGECGQVASAPTTIPLGALRSNAFARPKCDVVYAEEERYTLGWTLSCAGCKRGCLRHRAGNLLCWRLGKPIRNLKRAN